MKHINHINHINESITISRVKSNERKGVIQQINT